MDVKEVTAMRESGSGKANFLNLKRIVLCVQFYMIEQTIGFEGND
jgi:hypothetical protein